MYDSCNLAIKIKSIAKTHNISITQMLKDCSLGSNTMSAMYHGKSIAFDRLALIADYLNCSVDYLLGRTDNPEFHNLRTEYDSVSSCNDQQLADIIKIYKQLDNVGKAKLLVAADELKKSN